jgi:hypothetical protein
MQVASPNSEEDIQRFITRQRRGSLNSKKGIFKTGTSRNGNQSKPADPGRRVLDRSIDLEEIRNGGTKRSVSKQIVQSMG